MYCKWEDPYFCRHEEKCKLINRQHQFDCLTSVLYTAFCVCNLFQIPADLKPVLQESSPWDTIRILVYHPEETVAVSLADHSIKYQQGQHKRFGITMTWWSLYSKAMVMIWNHGTAQADYCDTMLLYHCSSDAISVLPSLPYSRTIALPLQSLWGCWVLCSKEMLHLNTLSEQ